MRALMPEHRAIAAEAIRRVRLAHLDDESGYRATARALSPLLLSAGDMAFVYDWRDGLGKVGHTRADGASWNSIVRHDLLAPLIRYDPTRPGPDANRIVPSWRWSSAAPAVRLMRSAFWPLNDFGEQVRSALYDGERYLGLVGIFSDGRHDKPSLETIRMFAAVMPAAAEVLWGEALVRRSEETRLPFDRLLDAMEAPTLLVAPSGTVLHATPLGSRHDRHAAARRTRAWTRLQRGLAGPALCRAGGGDAGSRSNDVDRPTEDLNARERAASRLPSARR
jgi:hypothetical protein